MVNTRSGSVKRLAVDGIKWQLVATTVNRGIQFSATLILARFLGPSVFGLYALTIAIVNSFELFKSMGLDTALIRRKEDFLLAADSAFFIIPLLGLVLYSAMALSAPHIAAMFKNPEVAVTMRVLGLAFVFNCFTRVPSALLERKMEFKQLSIAEIVTSSVFSVSAVILALTGFGVWSLVIAYVLKMFVYMVMVWRVAKWRPAFRFSPGIAMELFGFGKFIFLTSVVFFLKMNLDNLLVGKFLGVTVLGLYALAFNIANFSADYLGAKVYRVIYCAYSMIEREEERLKAAFLKTLKYLAMIALPVGTGICLLGDDFIGLVYGPKWAAASGALKILAVAGVFNTLPVGMTPVFMAKGKSSLGFWITGIQVVIFVLLIGPLASRAGIMGVSLVVTVASLISMICSFYWTRRLLAVTYAEYFSCLWPAAFSSLLMGGVIYVMKYAMVIPGAFNVHMAFLLIALAAAAVYGSLILLFEKTLLTEIKEVVS